MATSKSRTSGTADKNNHELVSSLKYKVKELEEEVATLKGRLDDLRKAKNTTITKREREIVEVGFPKRDPKYEAKIAELQKQLRDFEHARNKEIEELKRMHMKELEDAKSGKKNMEKELDDLRKKLAAEMKEMEDRLATQSKVKPCNHEEDMVRLKKRISDLEADNAALLVENNDLKERVSSLVTELSLKEAKWCEEEEKLKLKIKEGWGERYQQWMAETERKIQELQEANTILRQYLHRSGHEPPPDGRFSGESSS